MTTPERYYVKRFWKELPELWPSAIFLALLAFFLFTTSHPFVARIVAFVLAGLMFGMVVLTMGRIVDDYLVALANDREVEEKKMKKLAEDMTVPTREQIREIRDTLQAATEATHGVILRAEAVFARLGLTAELYLPLEEPERVRGKPASGIAHLLGWRKVDGRWRLVLESRPGSGLTGSSVCLLTASPRHYRLAALRALPLLHARLEAVSSARAPSEGSSPGGTPRPP